MKLSTTTKEAQEAEAWQAYQTVKAESRDVLVRLKAFSAYLDILEAVVKEEER